MRVQALQTLPGAKCGHASCTQTGILERGRHGYEAPEGCNVDGSQNSNRRRAHSRAGQATAQAERKGRKTYGSHTETGREIRSRKQGIESDAVGKSPSSRGFFALRQDFVPRYAGLSGFKYFAEGVHVGGQRERPQPVTIGYRPQLRLHS